MSAREEVDDLEAELERCLAEQARLRALGAKLAMDCTPRPSLGLTVLVVAVAASVAGIAYFAGIVHITQPPIVRLVPAPPTPREYRTLRQECADGDPLACLSSSSGRKEDRLVRACLLGHAETCRELRDGWNARQNAYGVLVGQILCELGHEACRVP
jgi:hypothetical protein